MFSCALCEDEWCYTSRLCEKCRRIKHIMNIYSKDKVLEVVEKVLVRNEEHIENTIKKEVGDESYIKPKTRSETKK